jgi:hypothetical protein
MRMLEKWVENKRGYLHRLRAVLELETSNNIVAFRNE